MTFNLFTNLPSDLPDELSTTLLEASNLRIERIVPHGHASPEGFWYDQDDHEWVVVLQGAARLQLEDKTIELRPGDYINLPAYTKHRVEWTTNDQPTIWLAIFYKPQAPPPPSTSPLLTGKKAIRSSRGMRPSVSPKTISQPTFCSTNPPMKAFYPTWSHFNANLLLGRSSQSLNPNST